MATNSSASARMRLAQLVRSVQAQSGRDCASAAARAGVDANYIKRIREGGIAAPNPRRVDAFLQFGLDAPLRVREVARALVFECRREKFAANPQGHALDRLTAVFAQSRFRTMNELANECHVSCAHLSRIFSGKRVPSKPVFGALARALDIPEHQVAEWFFDLAR